MSVSVSTVRPLRGLSDLDYICIMENMNLLDLDNDILNIIGDYVKKDNDERIFLEKYMKGVIGKISIELFEIIKNLTVSILKKK